jgi:hypothetical protein
LIPPTWRAHCHMVSSRQPTEVLIPVVLVVRRGGI